jgi:hypothetical protein
MSDAILSAKNRPLTLYIAGNPGSGKSSLIQNMVLHDVSAYPKRGACVIDPTGDLIDRVLAWIPRERVEDTIYFDADNPVPIDFFSYRDPGERQVLTDQLLDIFNLENAPVSRPRLMKILGTLFDANENPAILDHHRATFLDIQTFVESEKRREQLLSYCPYRKDQWPDALFSNFREFSSIIERMAPFTESPILRLMLGAKRPKLNIVEVMERNQILLVNLKDTPTDAFIGSLIASKFQQATFARRNIKSEANRIPYYLYIDECHTILHFSEREFEAILTRARKYNLCLTLANQIASDLPPAIQRKIGTVGNVILFNLDARDAALFKDRIAPYEIQHLLNLPKFKALCRTDNKVLLIDTPKFLGSSPASYAEIIRKRTIEKYACNTASEPNIMPQHDDDEPQPTRRPKGVPPHKNKARST